MAKCLICNSRKGKRKCKAVDALVCSLCCGQARDADKCKDCSFFKDASHGRNYGKVPYYGTQKMADSIALQDTANIIEQQLCALDNETENNLTDKTALQLLELAFDKYHFNDSEMVCSDPVLESLFKKMSQLIENDLADTPREQLIKVMAAIYRSVLRRTNGDREYFSFIQQYL